MKEPVKVTLDIREISPDEQHLAIIERLNALAPGGTLRLVNNHDLTPLYEHFLAEHSDLFTCEQEQEGPEEWVIRIQKRVRGGVAPSGEHDDEEHVHQISHVIQCMQCGLQFQADAVAVSNGGAEAEEWVLYPTVGRLMGAPEATATMSRDHQEIGRLIQELETLRPQLVGADVDEAEAQARRRIL